MNTASRFLSSGVLMIWGVVFAYFYFSGRIASYLHPSFHIYTALSGITLCMLAIVLLLTRSSEKHECCHTEHGFFRQVFLALVLVVPLISAMAISRNEFGAAAVTNRQLVENINDLPAANGMRGEEGSPYLLKTDKGYIAATTVDLLYAVAEPTLREDFENKEIEIIGQFMPARSGNAKGDRFNVVRMFVMCCAADARPVGVGVQASPAQIFPDMTWVKITGKATFPVEAGRHEALIIADSVTEISPPEESFLY